MKWRDLYNNMTKEINKIMKEPIEVPSDHGPVDDKGMDYENIQTDSKRKRSEDDK